MNRYIRSAKKIKYVLAMLGFAWLLLFQGSIAVQAEEKETIKVGFFAWDGYHMQDERGIRSGYGYDFLKMAENYNNWQYEYVGYDMGWSDMLRMLDEGEIDFVTFAQKSPDREEKYDFSDEPVGTGSVILTGREKDTRFVIGDRQSYDGMRVGIVKGSAHDEVFADFAMKNHFSYTPVFYDSIDGMKADLLEGKRIDVMLTSSLRSLKDEIVLEELNPTDFYAIVKKGNTELMDKINHAIALMNQNTPGWRYSLKNVYYSVSDTSKIALNQQELEYLEQLREDKRVFKVVTNPDLAPYSYFEDGEAKGIAVTIFTELAQQLGLSYEIIPLDTYEQYNAYIRAGKADIDLTCFSDYGLAEFHGLNLTSSYLDTSMAMLTRSSFDGTIDRIAMLAESQNNTIYSSELIQGVEKNTYETNRECIEAVKNGTSDAVYLYVYTAQKAVEEDVKNSLIYTIMPQYGINMAIGVNENEDYRLVAVLNEGIAREKGKYTQNVIEDEMASITKQDSPLALMYDYPGIAISIVAAFFVFVLVICLSIVGMLNARHKVQQEEKYRQVLEDALESAKSASKAKGQFLSKMSHEIRTPLNAVIGYMEIARESEDQPEKLMHCIENSDVAAKHLLSIINDVLDMSSIESGKMKIAHEDFDLKKQITALSTIFYNQAKEKQVRFEVELAEITQEWVIGDSLRLNQILMNLLSNAVKFTPQGGTVTLAVRQVKQLENRVYFRFEVTDTGIGMTQEYMSRLFSPFEQESARTAQKYGGTGLGLSITHNLVGMMGGTMDVRSELGEGSTFIVSLYFELSDKQHKTQSQQDYSHLRVLIVDDDKSSCDYMKELFKRCKIKSDTVRDGAGAIRQMQRRMGTDYTYDLCVIDWNMPQMDGVETAKQIREQCSPDMPVIIATAYDAGEVREVAKKAGIDMVVSKPLFESTVFDLLVNTFGKYEPEVKPQAAQERRSLEGMHILLAEDNAMNMEIAVDILSKAGIIVTQALDGQQACDIFASQPEGTFDAILMDIQMPRLNGYEATEQIRRSAHPQAGQIPIIAMTANAFAEDVNAALAAGMNDHVSKPINYDKLFIALNKCRRQS